MEAEWDFEEVRGIVFICLFQLFALLQPDLCLLWLQSLENCQ